MTSIYGSSTSNSSSANLLRISGMASGIDTDAVVKSMVSNYQTKIDKANAAKQTVQWQQEGYREIITGIKGLQDYFDPLSSKYILSDNALNTNSVTNSDSDIVMATASSNAKTGTYKVNVSQLAEQAKIEGDSNNSILSVSALSNWNGKKLIFDVGGTKVDLTTLSTLAGSNTLELVADINSKIATSALNGKITASYVKEGTSEYIKFTKNSANTDTIKLMVSDNNDPTTGITDITDKTINSGISSSSKLVSNLGFSVGTVGFTLNNGATSSVISLTVDANTTVQDLMDKVNSTTDGAVTMSIDDTTGKISFQSKNYGAASSIAISAVSANMSTYLRISETTGTGKDAIVAITSPGQTTATTTTQSSNKFTLNGVSYNLVGLNEGVATSSILVAANSEKVITNVKEFIEDYNTIISTINTKLKETKDRDFTPLTDDQRESMTDDQIKTWETKAKVGILRKDDYLTNLMSQLRGTFYAPVYSSFDKTSTSTGKVALSFGNYGTGSIGIDTSSEYADDGKLIIKDETKLKNAIENNLEDFKKLFIGISSSDLDTNEAYIGSKKYNEDGIFKKIDVIMRDYVAAPGLGKDGTYTSAGYMNIFVNKQYDFSGTGSSGKNTLPDQVYNKVLSVSKFQLQLEAAQTRYYAKFTALETAMNSLNSQQSALSSMLGTSS